MERPTHLDAQGHAHVVDVREKAETHRIAVARARVRTRPEVARAILDGQTPKGDVAAVVRVAAIAGAKRTSDLVPLCHPLPLTHLAADFTVDPRGELTLVVRAECVGRTGVEMEAMAGASIGALTAYDMIKGLDRSARIEAVELLEKDGGRSGHYRRDAGDRIALVDRPILVDDVLAAVAHPSAGAQVLFLGTVRDHADGQPVTLLEYEAYATMAVAEMGRCVVEVEARFPEVRLAVTHRVGALRIGDVAVACAASAPHRGEAFGAARALIDAIKHQVPIWKREHGPDGPYWVDFVDARCTGEEHLHRGERHHHAHHAHEGKP